jgi:hypothetical protein
MQPTSPGAIILQPAPPPVQANKPKAAPSAPSDDPFSRLAPALR